MLRWVGPGQRSSRRSNRFWLNVGLVWRSSWVRSD